MSADSPDIQQVEELLTIPSSLPRLRTSNSGDF